ncbi:Uncharacterised protein [Flavonifractor plautii]|uniref:Uncharacterized protein n=1 Tax=Flavonifractor plautii TaxID=292800 RepID=A0A174DT15_FLAPL|nr:Uncharacterised protein [Flavonifractor plautii]
MIRVCPFSMSPTASQAAASGRQRNTRSAALRYFFRSAGSLRLASPMRSSSRSVRRESRSQS